MIFSPQEKHLCQRLRDLPSLHQYRYTPAAHNAVLETLFWSLANNNDDYFRRLFPQGPPSSSTGRWCLREAQGAVDGAEYGPAAQGKPCGHIFKNGEATYRCKTCSIDDTCVLCSKCFDSSDHSDHMIFVSISPGNSGCCDCGDLEAWRLPVNCAIHTAVPAHMEGLDRNSTVDAGLPDPLVKSIKMTIARAFDYTCDVISCSPEQLRLPKSESSIRLDEKASRLTSRYYNGDDIADENPEFALILWNDEKHTVEEVQDQVARACKQPRKFGLEKANETNDMGRSIIQHDRDISRLLAKSSIIEQIKVTVTIRSSRDTFREQMCGTIIEWLVDIAGCSVANDHDILRQTICEEMLKSWRTGSEASNAEIGRSGIDDQEKDEPEQLERVAFGHNEAQLRRIARGRNVAVPMPVEAEIIEISEASGDEDDDENDDENEDADVDGDGESEAGRPRQENDAMEVDFEVTEVDADGDLDMEATEEPDDETEVSEATYAGYPPPPLPPSRPRRRREDPDHTPSDSDTTETPVPSRPTETLIPRTVYAKANVDIPQTPSNDLSRPGHPRPPKHWLEKPAGYNAKKPVPLEEDLWKRVRLDWMILFDLRMWKKARIDLRDLYITTVVTIPRFKRILGLRFAGLYTTLAQLYLIADREPDHSIINLSLQMLTTPSITDEVVERGNFLTNLVAILYTFLTTRQVGHPQDVNPKATLAFEAGSLTNRRMYHFFMDLRYLFGSEHVQEKLRNEERYMLQFLDLVKLHQGICPNVRAVGDHIEYETDAWISASLITRELNRLCRQFAESFRWRRGQDDTSISRAIRVAAKAAILNSTGSELKRFDQAEIKEETRFKRIGGFELDTDDWGRTTEYRVVRFTVEKQPISFHHGLHYTLSWLIDCGKSMPREHLRQLMSFSTFDLAQNVSPRSDGFTNQEDFLLALFDFPLRVCAWLAQMKAGMWVRNGLSLRHQMSTYRGVSQRDVAHQRDIFLLQTAFVTCNPSRVLASMIDRFGMDHWMKGTYEVRPGYDENQILDVAEDFVHLMIVLLCDRTSLIPVEDEPNAPTMAMKRDIAHVLCFKPLSFSELAARLADKLQDMEEFQDILDEMTKFRPPEGLADSGTFELKEEYVEEIDPYIAHYSKNQREESEYAYRARISKKTGKADDDVVFEPKLRPIESGVFTDLAAFTRTNLFGQVIYNSLRYPMLVKLWTPNIPYTRLETYLQVVLHLTLLAVSEDSSNEEDMSEDSAESFITLTLTKTSKAAPQDQRSIIGLLQSLSAVDEFRACQPKIRLIFRRMQQKRPRTFASAVASLGLPIDRMDTESPASVTVEDLATKKKMALDRKAKVMAQFQQQQQNFLNNQGGIDWGAEDSDDLEKDECHVEEQRKMWKYPSGTCILCQEETNDSRLYGTFALIADSNILRQTDLTDLHFVAEAAMVPPSLDRSAEDFRPFGISGQNREMFRKLTADGTELVTERQILGKGFPASQVRRGPVTTGCGHIMHYACFEHYYQATQRRQGHQIARAHPERLDKKEFVCPLCKALGNAFLPIIWKGKEEVFPGALQPRDGFSEWLCSQIGPVVSRLEKAAERDGQEKQALARYQEMFVNYISRAVIPPLANKIDHLARSNIPMLPPMAQLGSNQGHGILPLDATMAVTSPSPAVSSEFLAMVELANIYKRLRDTIKVNHLPSRYSYPPAPVGICEDLPFTDTLARTLGFSISAVEIAQRGIQSEPGSTLLDKVSTQSLTLLRILSETVSSFIAIGGMLNGGANKTVSEFTDTHRRQLHQLFVGHPQIFDGGVLALELKQVDPLLTQDAFIFLAECSVCIVPALHLDVHHVLRLCYLAEIVKLILAIMRESDAVLQAESHADPASEQVTEHSDERLECLQRFASRLSDIYEETTHAFPSNVSEQQRPPLQSRQFLSKLRTLMERYALCFLRKAVILLHTRFGVDFPSTGFSDLGEAEIDRLTKALRLDSLDQVFASFLATDSVSTVTQAIASGWIRHWVWAREGKRAYQQAKVALSVSHPAIFELVGLPKHFDTLSEEAMKRPCPTTGKELTDPSVCLFCGEIFCSQAQCCSREGKIGGCNQHVEKQVYLPHTETGWPCILTQMDRCGQHIGLFINIRKCTVLYLHDQLGSWHTAPYLDKHGEVDAGLRRNRRLFLNQRRYDALLRSVWLQHGIPTTISRKLEADVNSGGWETI